jgi:hypothetical protein
VPPVGQLAAAWDVWELGVGSLLCQMPHGCIPSRVPLLTVPPCPALPAGKRLASVDVENTEENRRDWRQLLYTAPGEQPLQAGGQQAGRLAALSKLCTACKAEHLGCLAGTWRHQHQQRGSAWLIVCMYCLYCCRPGAVHLWLHHV